MNRPISPLDAVAESRLEEEQARREAAPPEEPLFSPAMAAEYEEIRLAPGDRVATRYEVVRFLGFGATGATYRVRDEATNGELVLRVLLPSAMESPRARLRFLREMEAVQGIRHENLARVFEFGEDQERGLLYFTRGYVDGDTLERILEEWGGRMPPERAGEVAAQIAAAMERVHRATVHLNLNPRNVFLDREGRVRITDVGLGEVLTRRRLRAAGAALDTTAYLAPELSTPLGEADRRADVYSLGVLLYRMLTGELPAGRVPPPSVIAPKVPRGLDAIAMRCLAPRSVERYGSMGAVRRDLLRRAFGTRRPWAAALVAALLVLAVVGLAMSIDVTPDRPAARNMAVRTAPTSKETQAIRERASTLLEEPAEETEDAQVAEPEDEVEPMGEVEPVADERDLAEAKPAPLEVEAVVPPPADPIAPTPPLENLASRASEASRPHEADRERELQPELPDVLPGPEASLPGETPPREAVRQVLLAPLPPLDPDLEGSDTIAGTVEGSAATEELDRLIEPLEGLPNAETPESPLAVEDEVEGVAAPRREAMEARTAALGAGADRKAPRLYAEAQAALESARAQEQAIGSAAAASAYRVAARAFERARLAADQPAVSLKLARVVEGPDGPRAEFVFDLLGGKKRSEVLQEGEMVADGWRLERVDAAGSSVTLRRGNETLTLRGAGTAARESAVAQSAAPAPAPRPAFPTTPTPARAPESARSYKVLPTQGVVPTERAQAAGQEIAAALDEWIRAAEQRDVSRHVSAYADRLDTYFTRRNVSKEAVWADKRAFFSSYDTIDLSLKNIEVDVRGENTAVVTFDKAWNAVGNGKTFSGEERQQLVLHRIGGQWKITSEKELKVYWVKR